jgi:lipopolysaccharide transport system ATP-binding protein
MNPAIEFNRVSKQFRLRRNSPRSFQELFLNAIRLRVRQPMEVIRSLEDVTFSIGAGEMVGLIGANGAGKSTALKLVSRIIAPTEGTVNVNGRVTGLLELGAGFHPDLTGRENVFLNGAMLGMKRRQMERRLDAIIGFAELAQFIDMPVKHYSSGMYMRLGFATAVYSDVDLLLVDEVLAVGDQAFQSKCVAKVRELHKEGKTILFVTHDLDMVTRLCDRALWLGEGKLRRDGRPEKVVADYLNHILSKGRQDAVRPPNELSDERDAEESDAERGTRWGSGEVLIDSVRFYDENGKERSTFEIGEQMIVRIRYHARERVEHPVFGIAIHREDRVQINESNTRFAGLDIPYVEGEGELVFRQPLPLLGGGYFFSAAVYDYDIVNAYDHREQQFAFRVNSETALERYGVVRINSSWEHLPVPELP